MKMNVDLYFSGKYRNISRTLLREQVDMWVIANENLELYCDKDRNGIYQGKAMNHDEYRGVIQSSPVVAFHSLNTNIVEIKNMNENTASGIEKLIESNELLRFGKQDAMRPFLISNKTRYQL